MSHHLVGVAEIAVMLGVSRQRVDQLASSYDDFPQPEVELAGGRVWSRSAIETWMALHHERKPGRPDASRRAMFERYTDRARRAVTQALEEAKALNHNYIGCEHLLLGLISIGEGLAAETFAALGLPLDPARETVEAIVGTGASRPEGHLPFTPRAVDALKLAATASEELGHNYIGTEHVALGILREGDNVGCRVLTELGLSLERVRLKLLERMGFPQPEAGADAPSPAAGPSFAEQVLRRLDAIDARLGSLEGRLEEA